jgi:para-aminobenzoate synthetase component 1
MSSAPALAPAIGATARLAGRPGRVLLHSGRDDDGCGRFSFVASDPTRTLVTRGASVCVCDEGGAVHTVTTADPLAALQELVLGAARERPGCVGGDGGPVPVAIGFFSYDLGRSIERLPGRVPDPAVPDVWLGFYDAVWRHDEHTGRAEIVGPDPVARRGLAEALARGLPAPAPAPRFGALAAVEDDGWYARAFARVRAYIEAGDVYQVNLARCLGAPMLTDGDALAVYAALARRGPSAYGGLIEAGEVRVIAGSPERFLTRPAGSDRLETRPIKGTRRRAHHPAGDRALAAELASDGKEAAEHLMIVDLLRNDLGRVARPGAVRVDSFARIVELPTLYHMVSTVSADLRADVGPAAILRAIFPGGSITGAPKVRAMQIIDELEPHARGVYTGALGYFGVGGALDLAIAIRTATLVGGELRLGVGGAVVADSTLAGELGEIEHKAAAWRAALADLATCEGPFPRTSA